MSSWMQGILVTFLTVCFSTTGTAFWWVTDGPLLFKANDLCQKVRQLNGDGKYASQVKMCNSDDHEIVQKVVDGSKLALSECQYQFRYRPWNCTNRYRSISKTLQRDTRESAYLRAISAAGVLYAVTQACSSGQLAACTCARNRSPKAKPHPKSDWVWGGCSDDVDFGKRKSVQFMDVKSRRPADVKTKVHLQNNEAGRQILMRNVRKECKCHGLSASCTIKHCWERMPPFREVGELLLVEYGGATLVKIDNNTASGLIPVEGKTVKQPAPGDLVYTELSVNYCNKRRKAGSLGTSGRICDARHETIGGCDILCCGRGYFVEIVEVHKNCNCRFQWCCEVQCQSCTEMVTVHRCN